MSSRTFEAKPAKRERTPIIMGLVSPSGAGKTKSALRLADGFARVVPGPIVVVDTEAKRALHHSDAHKFLHVDFTEPFGPNDYIAALQEAMKHSPSTIIVDSMSHEWEGPGGILEQHDAELDRRGGNDDKARDRNNMAAWIKPKAQHNRLKQFMLQQRVNWIWCFRAKEKIKPVSGKQPLDLGWSALGAEDLIFECLVKCLLFPGADGKPTWRSDKMGEQALMKLPGWFRDLFATPRQLDEDIGEQLARWAAGSDIAAPSGPAAATSSRSKATLAERFAACTTRAEFDAIDAEVRATWRNLGEKQRDAIKVAGAAAQRRLEQTAARDGDRPPTPEEEAAMDGA